jgi:hypothetical protein
MRLKLLKSNAKPIKSFKLEIRSMKVRNRQNSKISKRKLKMLEGEMLQYKLDSQQKCKKENKWRNRAWKTETVLLTMIKRHTQWLVGRTLRLVRQ